MLSISCASVESKSFFSSYQSQPALPPETWMFQVILLSGFCSEVAETCQISFSDVQGLRSTAESALTIEKRGLSCVLPLAHCKAPRWA